MANEKKIKHLYARAGFGLSPIQLNKKGRLSVEKAVKDLFKSCKKIKAVKIPYYNMPSADDYKKLNKSERNIKRKEMQKLTGEVNLNWMRQMISDDYNPLQEKMTLFWHGHFACESKRFDFAGRQINTIRQYALGNFRDLVLAVAKDASMIIYLNNQQNRKKKPNENFARELMELFTIGRGIYTEQDIKESARAFTGWFARRMTGAFNFNEKEHDSGRKTFMGKTGNFDGDDIVDIILENKQTARFIATKIYRFFVNDNIDQEKVEILTNAFYNSNYNIEKMMRTLFDAPWFYDNKNVGVKIKSPVEFLIGIGRVIDIKFGNARSVLFPQHALGQVIFYPPNVAGWPGGKTWIDNSTLMLRMNFAALIFQKTDLMIKLKDQPEMKKGRALKKLDITADMRSLTRVFKKTKPDLLAQKLSNYLLQTPFNCSGSFVEELSAAASDEDKIKACTLAIMSLPEFQMC